MMNYQDLPRDYRPLAVGERVKDGDLMRVATRYAPVCTDQTCRLHAQGIDCGGVGHAVGDGEGGNRYWRASIQSGR